MHVLILGGSLDHPGGVEAFCDRSRAALEQRGGNLRVHRIPTSTAYLTWRKLPLYLRGLAALVRYRRNRPDVVWLQYVNLPDLTYLMLAKLLGCRVMVTPHLGSNWRSQSSPILRRLSGWALRRADRLALISKTQEMEINLPAHVPRSLIRNFLPVEILTAPLPDEAVAPATLQLIHSGRLSEGKGSFLVIDICAALRDVGVPFQARITGGADRDTYAMLDQLIRGHNLREQVAVLGRVPEDELLDHLRRSDVLIHPSKIDSYPLIVLEAMACTMLPVVMELAGARDMVETYGGAVVSQTGAINEAVDWLVAQDLIELRAKGRAAAQRVRADYAWDRCAGALEAALQACLAGDRALITEPEQLL
jgi:glycosyltransferase involved in cell wall biosynthesis